MQVITRKEAIAQGLTKFFTGKPCKHGHISEHWTAGGCIECQLSKRRVKNAERLNAEWEKYKQNNQNRFDIPIMSRQEARDAGSNFYFTGQACVNGHTTKRNTNTRECYGCRDAKRNKYVENGMFQLYSKRSRERHMEKRKADSKAWKMRNADHVRAYTKKWSQKNKEYLRLYRKANSAQRLFEAHLRRKKVIEATPEWVNRNLILAKYKEREKISKLTGVVYHVDHYYPLQGKIICGLNVPWNLQVITAEENLAKNNKMPEEFYGENHTPPTWKVAA